MKTATIHVRRDRAGVYTAQDERGSITVTAINLDKLIRDLEEAIAVQTPTTTDVVVSIKIIIDADFVIPGDEDAASAPILFPY